MPENETIFHCLTLLERNQIQRMHTCILKILVTTSPRPVGEAGDAGKHLQTTGVQFSEQDRFDDVLTLAKHLCDTHAHLEAPNDHDALIAEGESLIIKVGVTV
jgi:hypothetical protein